VTPAVPEDSPHAWDPPKYGTTVQLAEDPDTSPSVDASKTKLVQEVVGTFQFSSWAVNPTTLVALSSIATQQNNVTEGTMKAVTQLLNYAASHPDPMIQFKRSDMQLEMSTNSSYLSVMKSCTCAGGYDHYLGNKRPDCPILPEDPLPMADEWFCPCSLFHHAHDCQCQLCGQSRNRRSLLQWQRRGPTVHGPRGNGPSTVRNANGV
jgi:hypothetical protein